MSCYFKCKERNKWNGLQQILESSQPTFEIVGLQNRNDGDWKLFLFNQESEITIWYILSVRQLSGFSEEIRE